MADASELEHPLKPKNSKDVGWRYAKFASATNRDKVRCDFCNAVFSGGIHRMKCHIAQIKGEVSICTKADEEAKKICYDAVVKCRKAKKKELEETIEMRNEVNIPEKRDVDDDYGMLGSSKKKKLGPIDEFVSRIDVDEDFLPKRKTRQQTITDHFARERWQAVANICAHWVYESGIPFNAIASPSFARLCEAIGKYGPGWFPPSQYQLREPLLKIDTAKTKEELFKTEEEWEKTGCSVMTDAWSDRKRRSIMNICVHCKLGTSFIGSIETGVDAHTGQYIFDYVNGTIDRIGEDKVVQVVTDNASNNMAAAKLLMVERPNIYWTSCSAHTINLMLTGIGNLKRFKDVIGKAQALVIFIYAHHSTLAMMRGFTQKRDIVRPGVTRFATAYLSLMSLVEKKEKLRLMFTSDEWVAHNLSRCTRGKRSTATVLSTQFWSGVQSCLNAFGPLVDVLRMVDGDKPSMGFVYGEFQIAIKKIKEYFGHYKDNTLSNIMNIIEEKKRDQDGKERIASALHLTGYLLNPYYYYKDSSIENEPNVSDAVLECIEKFFPNNDALQSIVANKELLVYKNKEGVFGKNLAINGCKVNDADYDPVGWWSIYGNSTPNLKRMAQRILALTSSSSGCERNWSCFEGIHTKKRNRLDAERLNDLVYVQFNAKLKNKRKKKIEEKIDPLLSDDSRYAQGWVVRGGDEIEDVEPISGISWEVISEISGADEILTSRRSTRNQDAQENSTMRDIDEDEFHSEKESADEGGFDADDNEFEDE